MKKMNFSRNFTVLRKANSMTQEGIAEKCGVSRQAVTKWETGSSLPDSYKLLDISELFGISVDELLCGEFGEKKGSQISDELAERLEDIVYKALQKVQNAEKPIDVYEEYEKYHGIDFEDDVPGDIFYMAGCEEAEKHNFDDAISLFEEALVRGEIDAADAIISTYSDITDIYAYNNDDSSYYKYKLLMARKMQEYGKIIEAEIKRRLY